MIESLDNKASLNTTIAKHKGMEETQLIHGYVTVIKNVGTANEEVICLNKPNLLTDAGRDLFHAQCYTNTSAGTRGAGFIALTTDSAAASAASTTLASEITTGGLARADASTKSHTAGTNTTSIQHTFTASATHTAVVKAGLFNAASSGVLAHENTFTTVTLQSSDTLQVTWTITLG